MMVTLDNYTNKTNLNDEYEMISDGNSKDDLTLITANNVTERAQSVIDDDVGSYSNLDYYPVKEFPNEKAFQPSKTIEPIEIINVPERIQSYEDKSHIIKCEDSVDSFRPQQHEGHRGRDVDEYDLEPRHYGYDDSDRYCDELVQTVRHIPFPSVILTRHETPQHRPESPIYDTKHQTRAPIAPPTTDIGRQITQLARRIESLGNISRICQDDIENRPTIARTEDLIESSQMIPQKDDYSLKAARKLDSIERLQKKQEAMQNRLVDLAKKLNDSTRDLTRLSNAPTAPEEHVNNDEYFHGKILKSPKKSGKKSGVKTRKPNKSISKSPPSSTFLKNILNDANETKANELPLLSSSYCLHNDLSTGSPESGISESTSKYLNDELANIRSEFRNQVEEIRKLLSDRYQQSEIFAKKNQSTQHAHESLADQIAKSIQKLNRDSSPTLRNITNTNNNNNEECPLDKYLVKSNKTAELPSLHSEMNPSLRPGILPSVARAIKNKHRMLSDPLEAEKFLIELSNRRANLENNLSCLERTKEGEFLFSILEKLQGDERDVDAARIQAMVDDAISSMNPVVNQEVRTEFQNWIERRRQREQQLLAEEEEKQLASKKRCIKPTKLIQFNNYNPFPSGSAVPGKPWVCKKYLDVRSRIDSGVRKLPEKTISRVPRSGSPPKTTVVPISDIHATWANRRRYRTPYLHFVNDVKLAKKPIAPLGSQVRKPPPSSGTWKKTTTMKKSVPPSQLTDDDLMLMSVKQYSLNYKEDEEKPVPPRAPQVDNKATSPHVIPDPIGTRPREEPVQPPSPTLSERGTGFQLRTKMSSKPREDRVGPYAPVDPLDTTRIDSHPVHVFIDKSQRRQSPVNVGPDINNLRHLIERALLDQIELPTPTTSLDQSETLTRGDNIATPQPTDGLDTYSAQFSPEHSVRDHDDRTVTSYDDIKTPEASQVISDYSFKPSRVSTPSNSALSSHRAPPEKKTIKLEMVSAAMQTICDNAMQTQEAKGVQTMPSNSATQTPKTPRQSRSAESYSTTSDFNGSQSDTQAHSFSDGMWLYDRSEGEMAPIQIDTVDRWKMGPCPDHPLWYNGTDDIMNIDRHSSLSFGEFTKPTLAGLIPTQDPVLQLKTLPFKQVYETPGFDNDGDEFVYMGHHQKPMSPRFRSLGVVRDSQSKFTTPRNQHGSPTNFNDDSEAGEVEFIDDDADSFRGPGADRPRDEGRENQSPEEYRHRSPYLKNMRQSNESGALTDSGPPFRDSQSDRMHIDVNKYLRASKQSHTDTSDAAGLLSTAQIVANAFRGGDSADFEGTSDFGMDRYYDNQHVAKPAVKIPTLGTVEQSNPSISDDNLEIIDI